MDEFYEWYQYDTPGESVSVAEFIKDVNQVPAVIVNGLTKCWRYPGARIAWVVGPAPLIKALGQCGGFLDGGASHILQNAFLPVFEPKRVIQDRLALQAHFKVRAKFLISCCVST